MINNVIYWSDMETKKIMKMKRGEGPQVLIESGLSLVEGLAYDWVAENLYWLDSKLNSIQVSTAEGHNRMILVNQVSIL